MRLAVATSFHGINLSRSNASTPYYFCTTNVFGISLTFFHMLEMFAGYMAAAVMLLGYRMHGNTEYVQGGTTDMTSWLHSENGRSDHIFPFPILSIHFQIIHTFTQQSVIVQVCIIIKPCFCLYSHTSLFHTNSNASLVF